MKLLSKLLLAATAALSVAAIPLKVQSGTVDNVIVTHNNTLNATNTASDFVHDPAGKLALSLVNNLQGDQVYCYVTGLDANNELVILQKDGTFYKPKASGTKLQPVNAPIDIPISGYKQTTNLAIPAYISSARVWFAEGKLQFFVTAGPNGAPSLVEPSVVNPKDPSADINWGFVELTNTKQGGLYANISYVDFVGLPLGMSLSTVSGQTQTAKGLAGNAVDSICNDLIAQSKSDSQPWKSLCVKSSKGKNLRVLNPTDYTSLHSDAFAKYWQPYVDKVWTQFSTSTLTVDTQSAKGKVACKVNGNTMTCAGDNRGYAKPSAADIFGCNSGPFGIQSGDNDVHKAVVPRLCAAINRATFFVTGGSTQPGPKSSLNYQSSPSNHYSRIVHKYEVDGKGYAFAYDDVNIAGENESGVVSAADPTKLEITIGGAS